MKSRFSLHRLGIAGVALLAGTAMTTAVSVVVAQEPKIVGQDRVTFTKDVAPILQRACQNCHRPGSIAPMSLLTFQDSRPWARSIKQKVANREMPPWFIDRTIGIQKFKDDPSLTDEEVAKIVAWVDGGAPEGNPADMRPPKKFDDLDKWHIGKPDLIVQIPEQWTIPPSGSDRWPDLYSESGLTEDRYIKAVEFKPGSPAGYRVIHHAHQYLIPPGADNDLDPLNSTPGLDQGEQSLNEYSAGKGGDIFPEDTGRLMKAGSKVHFNMHFHSIGEEVKDRGAVGLIFYPKGVVPKHVLQTVNVDFTMGRDLDIPANGVTRTDGYHHFDKPVKITSFQPHMHDRGKRECIEAIYPNNQKETLDCASFYFGWAVIYNYADEAAPILPAGSTLHVINWHDNTASNRGNPDPLNWVGAGNRTIDEMSFSWVNFYELSQQEYGQEIEARRARMRVSTNQGQQ